MEKQSLEVDIQIQSHIDGKVDPDSSGKKIYKLKNLKLKLKDKKDVVEKYFEFLKNGCIKIKSDHDLFDSDVDEHEPNVIESKSSEANLLKQQQQKSVGSFLNQFNQGRSVPLDTVTVCRWLRAFQRGEFEDWNGENDLNNLKCKSEKIIKIISKSLKRKFPDSGMLNKVAKSKVSPEQYGVFAKKNIKSGTMLGFFKGEEVVSVAEVIGPHRKLNDNIHIDGSDYLSCFARYYVSSSQEDKQNVTVQRLTEWSDWNRAICFIANKNISTGDELIIAPDHDYVQNKYKLPKIDLRFRNEAMALAAAFGK
jgi:hypothetical protein